jgi:hypothetical protein
METEIIPQCPKCGADIKVVPSGISKRTGKPYQYIKSCTNRECDWTGRIGEEPKAKPEIYRKEPQQNPQLMILETIQEEFKKLNERLDALGEYLSKKLK